MADVFPNSTKDKKSKLFDFSATHQLYFEPKNIDQGVKSLLTISYKTNLISPKKTPPKRLNLANHYDLGKLNICDSLGAKLIFVIVD